MKVSFVSTQAISDAMRQTMFRIQKELLQAQTEVATGRVADQGLALGAMTGRSVSLARDAERLEGIISSNRLASERLGASQNALKQISDLSTSFMATLTASASGNANSGVLRQDAKSTLSAISSVLNTSLNGEYLFAGINTDVQPINPFGPGSPAKAALDAAFLGHFGFAQTDPGAAGISAADMEAFIDFVEPQFLGAGWEGIWSNATDQTITARIALNDTAQTSVSANTEGVRKMMMAAALAADLLEGPLSVGAQGVLVDRAVKLTGAAIADLADLQAATGVVEQRVKNANERLEMQIEIFSRGVSNLEAVDPYEASTRVAALLGQIETSYALTARMQQLSLLRYLP